MKQRTRRSLVVSTTAGCILLSSSSSIIQQQVVVDAAAGCVSINPQATDDWCAPSGMCEAYPDYCAYEGGGVGGSPNPDPAPVPVPVTNRPTKAPVEPQPQPQPSPSPPSSGDGSSCISINPQATDAWCSAEGMCDAYPDYCGYSGSGSGSNPSPSPPPPSPPVVSDPDPSPSPPSGDGGSTPSGDGLAQMTYHMYYEDTSMLTVSCSDGVNGLITRWGYDDMQQMYPYVSAVSNIAWNSDKCGLCYKLTNIHDTSMEIFVTGLDQCGQPPNGSGEDLHFDLSEPAFIELYGSNTKGVDQAVYEVVDSSNCLGNLGTGSSSSSSSSSSGDDESEEPDIIIQQPVDSGSDEDITDIITREQFAAMFPNINNPACKGGNTFTYDNFITAAKLYPTFGTTGSPHMRAREIAAFLAQTSQETSGWWSGQPYTWGYCFNEEVGCESGCSQYCSSGNTQYPCKNGQSYHGRGPIQLSWNYNYGQVSQALYGDSNILLNNPDKVISDGVTAYQTAFWFWMTPQSPKPSCHDVMVGNWEPTNSDRNKGREPGFGMTTNIINGGLECNKPTPAKVENRVNYYLTYVEELDTTPGSTVYCNNMQNY